MGLKGQTVVEVSGQVAGDDSGSAFAGLGQRGLVSRMHEQLDELLAARDQMEQLLQVIVEIGSDLDLDANATTDHPGGQGVDLCPLRRAGHT